MKFAGQFDVKYEHYLRASLTPNQKAYICSDGSYSLGVMT